MCSPTRVVENEEEWGEMREKFRKAAVYGDVQFYFKLGGLNHIYATASVYDKTEPGSRTSLLVFEIFLYICFSNK